MPRRRSEHIDVPVDEKTKAEFAEYAEEYGVTQPSILRRIIDKLLGRVDGDPMMLTEEDWKAIREDSAHRAPGAGRPRGRKNNPK